MGQSRLLCVPCNAYHIRGIKGPGRIPSTCFLGKYFSLYHSLAAPRPWRFWLGLPTRVLLLFIASGRFLCRESVDHFRTQSLGRLNACVCSPYVDLLNFVNCQKCGANQLSRPDLAHYHSDFILCHGDSAHRSAIKASRMSCLGLRQPT